MTANQTQRSSQQPYTFTDLFKQGRGGGEFHWKVRENKWVSNCDLNEENVCVWRMEKGRLLQVTKRNTNKKISNRLHNLNTFPPLPNAQRRRATRILFQEKRSKESRPNYNRLLDLDVLQAMRPVYPSHENRLRTLRTKQNKTKQTKQKTKKKRRSTECKHAVSHLISQTHLCHTSVTRFN